MAVHSEHGSPSDVPRRGVELPHAGAPSAAPLAIAASAIPARSLKERMRQGTTALRETGCGLPSFAA